jgi:hypothetical protein
MDGLFFLMSVVGIGVVMWWVFQNDALPPDKTPGGLFAMLPGSRLIRRRGLRGWLAAHPQPPAKNQGPFERP